MPRPIILVQGGQWGSEAKGAVAAYLCRKDRVDWAVRTGATNAGHCVVVNGEKLKMQQLPVGFVSPKTKLVLGAGALIDLDILEREIREIRRVTERDPEIYVDYRAGVHTKDHAQRSAESGHHHDFGATGKGCSFALVDRIMGRGKGYEPIGEYLKHHAGNSGYMVTDTEELLNDAYDRGDKILLEGTQGTGLDLYLGPYPYVTHKQCGPAQWMMEAGLSPSLLTDVVMVVRTYPIRVAGNSGPMPGEISWPRLAREINSKREEADLSAIVPEWAIKEFEAAVVEAAAREPMKIPLGVSLVEQGEWENREDYAAALSELNRCAWERLPGMTRRTLKTLFEMTTVTKKLRRVANLDLVELNKFARQVRPNRVAVTFMNYVFPDRWYDDSGKPLTSEQQAYLDEIEDACGAPVDIVNWGPDERHIQEAR